MASPRNPEPAPAAGAVAGDGRGRAPAGGDGTGVGRDGGPGPVVRRAPFSDSPHVGARGQRTQQRILDAALRAFGEQGYHQCGVARITELAGCSRASFYQYFSGKEDVFRHLAGQVARQLGASTEAIGILAPDAGGWAEARAFVERYGETYARYEPVFATFQAAAESDASVAGSSARVGERHQAAIASRLATTALPPRRLVPVIALLLEALPRALDVAGILRSAAPGPYPPERIEVAITDVVHRTLFGLRDVNVHPPPSGGRPPLLRFGPAMWGALRHDDAGPGLNTAGRRTLEALVEAGREVFVTRGYHRARVDDVVEAAGVSHGAFYRYFRSKDQFAQVLAVRAFRTLSGVLADIPRAAALDGPTGRAALRRSLRNYNTLQAAEAAMIGVWVDATLEGPWLVEDTAAALDWGRRRLAAFLRPRGFGDVDAEAVVLVALLSAFGARARSSDAVDAAAHVVERGLLGR